MDPLVAAFITAGASGVIGVIVAESFAYFREKRRDAEQAKEKGDQRLHELRRDVYLPAAESGVRYLTAMGRMIGPEVPLEELNRAAEQFHAAMSRVHMVAGPGTVRRVAELQREITNVHFDVIAERTPLVLRHQEIERTNGYIDAHARDVQRFIEMLKMLNIEGRGNSDQFAMVQRQAEIASENLRDAQDRVDELWKLQTAEQREFLGRLLPRLDAIAGRQTNALVAVRTELKIEDSTDVLRQELAANLSNLHAATQRLISQLPRHLGDEEQGE